MSENQILPIEEMLAYDEFTDRVELLRQLDLWINNIQRMASPALQLFRPDAWEKLHGWTDW
jgi:hypothetical protein